MWSFWKNKKVRQARVKEFQRKLLLEPLEDRRVLAGNVNAVLAGGSLYLTGDALGNDVRITFTANNLVNITGNALTTINGVAALNGTPVTGSIFASFAGGDDRLRVDTLGGPAVDFSLTGGGITYNGGDGVNDFSIRDLTLGAAAGTKDLAVTNADNLALLVGVNDTRIDDLVARKVTVLNGANNSTNTVIGDSALSGTVYVSNAGGVGTTHSVTIDPTTIGGNLQIFNAIVAGAHSNTVNLPDVKVVGDTTIQNGPAATNNVIDIGDVSADLDGKLTAINDTAGGSNTINIDRGTIGTAGFVADHVYLHNGNAATSRIVVGDSALVTIFDGNLTIIDGTGNGVLAASRVSLAKNLTISDSGGANLVFVAGGGGTATVGGTTSITTGGGADTVDIGGLASLTGATTIITAGGGDTVNIGTTGTATLSKITVFLGAGIDTLNIGAGANGAAFAAIANFWFDGGADFDTANVKVSVFTPAPIVFLTKFFNFESIVLIP